MQKLRLHSSLLTLLTLAVILFSIPLTVVVLQTNQDNRQEAASRKKKISIPALKLGSKKYVPGKIKVRFKKRGGTSIQAKSSTEERIRKKAKARRVTRHQDLNIDELDVAPGSEDRTVLELRSDPDVERVDRVGAVYALGTPNDTEFSKQYNMSQIKAPAAWDTTEGSEDIIIGIVDSGVDENHPDLKGKIVSGSKVFHANVNTTEDNSGHGTHVAGIAAAITNNDKGVAGVCPKCTILNVKVLDPDNNTNPGKPAGDNTNIAKGLRYAVDHGAKVINMSFASEVDDPDVREAIDYAYDKGVILVAGAGNNGNSTMLWPAAYTDKVIAVGAVDANNNKTSFSNYGDYVDVAAPGDKIWSTFKGSQYQEMSGTSMASPHIAGLAGLLLSQGLSPDEVRKKITGTTDKTNGDAKYWQNGRINAARAVGADTSGPEEEPAEDPTEEPDEPTEDSPTSDPCVTPEDSENADKAPKTPKTPETNTKQPKTPSGKAPTTSTPGNKKSSSLYQRVSQNAQELRSKFFGGNTNTGKGASRPQGDKGAKKEAKKATKNTTNLKKNSTKVQASTDEPCDPGGSGGNTKKPNKAPKPTKVLSDRKAAKRAAAPRPTRIKNSGNTPDSSKDGSEKVITNPGSGGVTTIKERTCEPATVKTPGGVTTIPCDEAKVQAISVLEYNTIIDCFSDTAPPKSCTSEKKSQADLNKDGKVNQLDYNIFLKNIKAQK